jgi:hypothetical protein
MNIGPAATDGNVGVGYPVVVSARAKDLLTFVSIWKL